MTEPEEVSSGIPKAEIFDETDESWNNIEGKIFPLMQELLHSDQPNSPLEGQQNQIIFPSAKDAFLSNRNTAAILKVDNKFAGFSLAMPYEVMDPEGFDPGNMTSDPDFLVPSRSIAYIYGSGIEKEHRNKGYIVGLTDTLLKELLKRGYSHVIRDAVKENNYADKLLRAYQNLSAGRDGKPFYRYIDHQYWPEIGEQRRFIINIADYLKLKS